MTLAIDPARIPDAARVAPVVQRRWLAGGELRTWEGPLEEVRAVVLHPGAGGAPAAPAALGGYPLLGEAEALHALDCACRAWDQGRGPWPSAPVGERLAALTAFADAMGGVRETVVRLIMWEIGKTRGDAEKEFDRTVVYIRDTVAALKDLDRTAARFQAVDGVVAQVRRAPLGVALCMGPFNYPLNETFTTLIPALAMGNPVVFKPAKLGVLLLEPLLELFARCFPPGVVNTIYGDGRVVVSPLIRSGRVDVLAFIGSSKVADLIRAQHPKPHRLRCVLGLEAKNAAIVTRHADLDQAVKECVLGSLSFNGQRCTALKMLWVERSLHAAFAERLAAAVDALRLALPWEAGAQLTPMAEPGKPAAMQALVDDACARGARVLNRRAGAVDATAFFPALVDGAAPGMRLWREEQFGPVVPLAAFDDLEQPLAFVRDSDYGQQASVFSRDPAEVARLVDGLASQVCRININAQCQRGPDVFPFTGRKDSAEGTLSVSDALRVFSIRSMVAARDNPASHAILGDIARERRSAFISTDWLF
ncbi:MAG: aldehyde dehydrogenase family protein [Planctomycetes bacterium]|nr:aldehyde dehydrogenase family protein [Planctomycetota bacterium]